MTSSANLLLFHIDGPSARDIDALVAELFDRGAMHIQQMPAFAPGGESRLALLVEVSGDSEGRIAEHLARVHGIARYHRMASTHVYRPVSKLSRPVVVTVNGHQIGQNVRFSLMGTERDPVHVSVHSDDVDSLAALIEKKEGRTVNTDRLRAQLQSLFQEETGFVLQLD